MRRPNPVIGCTTALALFLAGCADKIEPTDLSAVTAGNDRTLIEKVLGRPDAVVEPQGLTIASYSYNKGIHISKPSGGGVFGEGFGGPAPGAMLFGLILAPIDYAIRRSEASARQKGYLATIFDSDGKLVFARALEEPDPTSEKLTSIATRYQEAQSGNAAALIELSKITLIPGQKPMFLERAANSGSAQAAFELGQAYSQGEGVEQSDTQAVKWWLQAGEKDHLPAYSKVGKAYQFGTGVKSDMNEAIRWYERAAANGNVEALYLLGKLHENGDGMERNRIAALKWYSLAESKDPIAKGRKGLLVEKMTPAQVIEAERMAREWLEAHPQ